MLVAEVVARGVQLERDVADQLWDSLLHLVQNAVDHGVEPPESRGSKASAARLQVKAESAGPNVVLSVEDDGQGIDPAVVRKIAIERGVLSADAARALDDRATMDLLFRHGFSTRAQASRTSGRGVGLDVVRRRVEALGGSIGIDSRVGHGTRFTLTVPFAINSDARSSASARLSFRAASGRQIRSRGGTSMTRSNEENRGRPRADGLGPGFGDRQSKLNAAAHVQHVEVVQGQRNVLEFAFRREVLVDTADSADVALRHQF